VFVFALFRLSQGWVNRLGWGEAVQTLVLLLALWWVWGNTAGVADRFDPDQPAIQALVIGCMFGSFVLAVVAPEAFGPRGLVFAVAYLAVNVGRSLFLVAVTWGNEAQPLEVRVLFWFGVSAVPWLAGALAHGWARGVLWGVALAVDYAAFGLGAPTPGLGTATRAELAVSGEFLAERQRQFFIIALGELILVSGLTFASGGLGADRKAAVAHLHLPRRGGVRRRCRLSPESTARRRLGVVRPPGHGRRNRRDLRRRRTGHQAPVRADTPGVDRRRPRRTRAVPRRTGHP
jgi:low temperature requirement protein LtrA